MDKLTKKAFWQQWPKTAKRFRRAGRSRCFLRDEQGCCPIVGVARDLAVPRSVEGHLDWWRYTDDNRDGSWANKVAEASDGYGGFFLRLRLRWNLPGG